MRRRKQGFFRPVWLAYGSLLLVLGLTFGEPLLTRPPAQSEDPLRALANEAPDPFRPPPPWGRHRPLLLALHGATTLALGALAGAALRAPAGGLAAAAAFGLHPLHAGRLGAADTVAPGLFGLLAVAVLALLALPRGPLLIAATAAAVLLHPEGLALPALFLALGLPWRRATLGALAGALLSLTPLRLWPAPAGWLPPDPSPPPFGPPFLGALAQGLRHLLNPTAFPGSAFGAGGLPRAWAEGWAVFPWLFAVLALGGGTIFVWPRLGRFLLVLPALFLPAVLYGLTRPEGFRPALALLPVLALAWAFGALVAAGIPRGPLLRGGTVLVGGTVLLFSSWRSREAAQAHATPWSAARGAVAEGCRTAWVRRTRLEGLARSAYPRKALLDRLHLYLHAHPWDPAGWALLGRVEWALRRLDRAARAFRRALELRPHPSYRYQLAAVELFAHRPRAALSLLAQLPPAAPVRALTLLARGRLGEALPPPEPRAPALVLRAYGMVLAERGRFREALAYLERVRRARPRDALAAAYRGWCLLALGRTEKALDVLTFEALRDRSGFFAHKILGEFFLQPGPHRSRNQAFFHLRYFMRHDPNHPEAPRIREILRALSRGER